jgi:glutamate racemase
VELLTQGQIVADSLADYLNRHPEMEQRLGRSGEIRFYTTDEPAAFDRQATAFYGQEIRSKRLPADQLIH